MNKLFVGLDVATITGVAFWHPTLNLAQVTSIKGTPNEQLERIIILASASNLQPLFSMEMPVHFQNAKTTRSLLQRYGYIKHSLEGFGYPPYEANLNSVRSFLGCKKKEDVFFKFIPYFDKAGRGLTSDHTDALAVALYHAFDLDNTELDWDSLRIERLD